MNESKEAVELILKCCQKIGFYAGERPQKFLTQVANQIKASRGSGLFPDPYREHIAHAMRMIADSGPTDPPGAVAAVYLAARMEVCFRIISGRLTSAGRWVS